MAEYAAGKMTVVKATVLDLGKPQEPVDNSPEEQQSDQTDPASGEADDQPQAKAEEVGEEGDKTSPQQRAAFARERNRRQAAEQQAERNRVMLEQALDAISKITKGDQAKDQEDPRPKRLAFDDPEAFDRADEAWIRRDAAKTAKEEARAEFTKAEQGRTAQAVVNTYQERMTAFAAEHPDFEEVAMSEDLQISPAMTEAILSAEDGPAIHYWLGQNPEEAERIAQLQPVQAVREIGRIEALLARPVRRPRPTPITPLRQRNDGGSDAEPSMQEYGARRIAELRAQRANH